MHAIQTSGNTIRNTTADHLAGIAEDEIEDPRPYCEIIRQWSTLHPEYWSAVSSHQMRKLAQIARRYDKGYGHFTTRQNLQYEKYENERLQYQHRNLPHRCILDVVLISHDRSYAGPLPHLISHIL